MAKRAADHVARAVIASPGALPRQVDEVAGDVLGDHEGRGCSRSGYRFKDLPWRPEPPLMQESDRTARCHARCTADP